VTTRCGIVALAGPPNAGKSTLLNQLIGAKVSIVTHKVQTTRSRIRGIVVEGDSQLVLVDTPGIFSTAGRRLERAMVQAAWSAVEDADITVLLHDANRGLPKPEMLAIVARLRDKARRCVLALNKVDAVKRETLLRIAAAFDAAGGCERIFMISALNGDGVDDLLSWLAGELPEGPWLYPEDQLSDLPQRLIAAEMTREKLFLQLHQELPYALTVETENWEQFEDGSVKIEQTIYLQREAQKKIAIGAGGRTIKAVREAAQRELETMLGTKVHLFLFIKVREKWIDDPARYSDWGLDFQA
jgi:GTP-binding protein Era